MREIKHPLFGRALFEAILNNPDEIKTPWWRKKLPQPGIHFVKTKYRKVHQGDREKARRRRQIAEGRLKP